MKNVCVNSLDGSVFFPREKLISKSEYCRSYFLSGFKETDAAFINFPEYSLKTINNVVLEIFDWDQFPAALAFADQYAFVEFLKIAEIEICDTALHDELHEHQLAYLAELALRYFLCETFVPLIKTYRLREIPIVDGAISTIANQYTITKKAFFFGGYNQEPYEYVHNLPLTDLTQRNVYQMYAFYYLESKFLLYY